MTQASLFDRVNPEPAPDGMRSPSGVVWTRDNPLPVAPSSSPVARQASATGAQAAARIRGALTLRYVRLLKELGPLSDYEARAMLGCELSSINSTRAKLGDRVQAAPADQMETHRHASGAITHRTRWRLVHSEGIDT